MDISRCPTSCDLWR